MGQQLGSPDGVLVFDPSAFPKKGNASVGVQRGSGAAAWASSTTARWASTSPTPAALSHALVDVRLYLPEDWAKDKERRTKAGIPKGVRFRTRHELALEMLD